jgi:signal transduction histidine kinase
MLGGELPSEIKIPVIQFANPVFDWRQMQRWNISETQLPAASEIRFRELTIWDQYRWQIIAIVAIVLLQATLIIWLLYEHKRRREAEVEAHQRMSELAHMNRHATVGELSASMAHELSQPLTAILANAQAAEWIANSPSPAMAEIKEILADIKRDDQRAADIIQHLRSLLNKIPLEVKDLDLNQVVNEVFSFVAVQANMSNVTLSRVSGLQMPQIHGDRIQIQQVVLNLMVNGMEAMAESPVGSRKIVLRTEQVDDSFVEISVSDRGPGISADALEKVFDPFFTTKAAGMGMGLSIARTIVQAHGGRVWAENRDTGGAIFKLTLPLAKRVREFV